MCLQKIIFKEKKKKKKEEWKRRNICYWEDTWNVQIAYGNSFLTHAENHLLKNTSKLLHLQIQETT